MAKQLAATRLCQQLSRTISWGGRRDDILTLSTHHGQHCHQPLFPSSFLHWLQLRRPCTQRRTLAFDRLEDSNRMTNISAVWEKCQEKFHELKLYLLLSKPATYISVLTLLNKGSTFIKVLNVVGHLLLLSLLLPLPSERSERQRVTWPPKFLRVEC